MQLLGPSDGESVFLGGLGVRFMIDSDTTGGALSLVEHPIAPRTLAAPLHRHANEDEYSYVLEGRVGVQLGDDVLEAGPGDLVFKPRHHGHAFLNPRDEPARMLGFGAPAGFSRSFAEIAPRLPPERPEPDFEGLAAVQARYGLEMDLDSIERLSREHGLTALEP